MGEAERRSAEDFSWRSVAVGGYGPNLLYGVAEGAFIPVAVLSARALGASVGVAAAAIVVFGAGSLLANIPAGLLVRRVGERGALVLGGVLGVVAALLCRGADSIAVYLVAVGLLGAAGAVFKLARQSYLARVVPYRRRALAMSTLGGVYRIGVFVGPILGGLVIAAGGLAAAFWVVAAAMAAGGLLGLFVTGGRATDVDEGPVRLGAMVVQHRRVLATVGSGVLLVGMVRAARNAALPLWADRLGLAPEQTAFVFAASALADVLLFVPAGLATDRLGRRAIAVPAMVLMGLALVVMPLADGVVALGAAGVALGVGNGFTAGIVMTLGADHAPPGQRAEFLGVWRVLADLGTLGGPALISAVTALASLGPALVAVGVAGCLGGAVLHLSLRPGAVPPP